MQEGRPVEKRDFSLLFPSLADKATTMYASLLSFSFFCIFFFFQTFRSKNNKKYKKTER